MTQPTIPQETGIDRQLLLIDYEVHPVVVRSISSPTLKLSAR